MIAWRIRKAIGTLSMISVSQILQLEIRRQVLLLIWAFSCCLKAQTCLVWPTQWLRKFGISGLGFKTKQAPRVPIVFEISQSDYRATHPCDIIHAQRCWSFSWNICFPGDQSPQLFILSSQQWGLVSHAFIIKIEIIVFLKVKKREREWTISFFFFFNKRGFYYQHKLYLTRCILTHGHFLIVQM